MDVALAQAALGLGSVEPNPMVGAVIVRDGVEIAKGHHLRFGEPHAEIEAIAAAARNSQDIRGATLYVTLEPCCHHGKTPPCTDAIIAAGLARVVVGMVDPDSKVAGKGISILQRAGIEVTTGVREQEVRRLLRGYIKLRTQGRSWVICKWAQTADGFLALPQGQGQKRWISSEQSRQHVHQLRSQCDGILVGVGTVLADDPMLTNRSGSGRQPAPVVLDCRLRFPLQSQLVRNAKQSRLIVATSAEAVTKNPEKARQLRDSGVEILQLPSDGLRVDLPALLDELGSRQWTYLLVEGGAKVLESFFAAGLADELMVFVSPRTVGQAGRGLPQCDINQVRQKITLEQIDQCKFGDDEILRFLVSSK